GAPRGRREPRRAAHRSAARRRRCDRVLAGLPQRPHGLSPRRPLLRGGVSSVPDDPDLRARMMGIPVSKRDVAARRALPVERSRRTKLMIFDPGTDAAALAARLTGSGTRGTFAGEPSRGTNVGDLRL